MALMAWRRKNESKSDDAHLEESNLFNNFCDELLAEIIIRLPTVAVAVRFKMVCKRWYSLISSPLFISRFNHHRDVQSSFFFQFTYNCRIRDCICQQYDCSDSQIISDCSLLRNVFSLSFLPLSPIELRNVRFEASFADLILCSSITPTFETKNYYVSNLLTKQWIAIPPPPDHADPDFMEYFPSVGFLCVPPPCSECKPLYSSHHNFIVVRLHTCPPSRPCSRIKVEVYSTEDSQWRTLDLDVSSPMTLKRNGSLAYRGMLHWLNSDCIVVYDPLNNPERFFRIIDLPSTSSCFGVCQGRLRVVRVSHEHTYPEVDVWELEDYDSGLWNLVHKVDLQNLTYKGLPITEESTFFPEYVLSFHPKNGDVVYFHMGNGVAPVNMKTKIMEHYYPGWKNLLDSWVSAIPLADQWWPTPVAHFHLADHRWPPLRR